MSDPLDDLGTVAKFINKVNQKTAAFMERWSSIIRFIKYCYGLTEPIRRFFRPIVQFVTTRYMKVFDKYAYHDVDDVRTFYPRGAAITVGLTLALLYGLWIGIRPAGQLVADIYRVSVAEEYTMYFSKPQFKASIDAYQVTACMSRDECEGGDNALMFDILDNYALDFKFLFTRGEGYDPEYHIVSSFTSEFQECTVMATRKKPIIFNYVFGKIRWNPKLLGKAVCKPVVG